MYCKNCGNELKENASVCLNCGVSRGVGKKFCENCGYAVENENASVCTNCGASLASKATINFGQGENKSRLIAGLLGILLGGFGIHNFYLGYVGKGIAQIILSFCCGVGWIWGLIEGILILCGNINEDASGSPLDK